MIIKAFISDKPRLEPDFHKRWEGPDKGLICAWLKGVEKSATDPAMADQALNGELPVTAFRGGILKPIKDIKTIKTGSLHYLAYWQGLRGDDLCIDLATEPIMTCSRTGVSFQYTRDTDRLLASTDTDEVQP